MKPAVILILGLAVLAAACEQHPAKAPPSAAPTPAAADETAQSAAGAEAFLTRTYRDFRVWADATTGKGEPPPQPDRKTIYDRSTLALWAESDRLSGQDIGPIEADPMCECQDPAGMTSKIAMDSQAGTLAKAKVTLTLGGKVWQELTVDLTYEAGHWRIHDIENGDLPSFRETLLHYNKEMAPAAGKPA